MNDIDLQTFYEWLDTYPKGVLKWDLVDVQEGLRVINFYDKRMTMSKSSNCRWCSQYATASVEVSFDVPLGELHHLFASADNKKISWN